jgi:hypothetical protein
MSYERVIAEFRTNTWALREETYTAMLELIAMWGRGEKFNPEQVAARIAGANYGLHRTDGVRETAMLATSGGSRRGGSGSSSSGVVALIPVLGVISNRANMFSDVSAGGGTSVQKLTAQFRQAVSSSSVSTIVLDIDSPGGSVDVSLRTRRRNLRSERPKKNTRMRQHTWGKCCLCLMRSGFRSCDCTLGPVRFNWGLRFPRGPLEGTRKDGGQDFVHLRGKIQD